MDLPDAQDNLKKFKKEFPDKEVIEISAMNQTGIDEMITKLADLLDKVEETPIYKAEEY